MLIAPVTGCCWLRAVSQSESSHLCEDSNTTEAVPGATSANPAIGSAFSRHAPSAPQIENLYRVPAPTPGTNNSQTPDDPSERIGCERASHTLKSPAIRTPRALGAQTAK